MILFIYRLKNAWKPPANKNQFISAFNITFGHYKRASVFKLHRTSRKKYSYLLGLYTHFWNRINPYR